MKYIDVHTHLNLPEFQDDIHAIAQKTMNDDVMVINVGTGQETSLRAVALAKQYTHMRAIVGLHPIYAAPSYSTDTGEVFDTAFYTRLITTDRDHTIVAIGECGLDYFHGTEQTKALQEKAFVQQIELAIETGLPLMLHIRPSENSYDAYYDVLALLKRYTKDAPGLRGDVHFFAGTIDIAKEFLDLGFYISFTGVITFAQGYADLVRCVPMDRILSETDAPYVSPVPFRGQRNEPSHVREVVKKIAMIKGVPEDVVAEQIMRNAQLLFKLS